MNQSATREVLLVYCPAEKNEKTNTETKAKPINIFVEFMLNLCLEILLIYAFD